MIQQIWEYKVKADQIKNFEQLFSANGHISTLYKTSKAFKRIELIVKDSEQQIYVSISTWKTFDAFNNFAQLNVKKLKSIDKQIDALVERKDEIGIFEEE